MADVEQQPEQPQEVPPAADDGAAPEAPAAAAAEQPAAAADEPADAAEPAAPAVDPAAAAAKAAAIAARLLAGGAGGTPGENGNNKRPREEEDDLQGPSKRSTGALEGGADPPGANPAGTACPLCQKVQS
ncbi:putative transmembrane protein [Chlorella sorokiniana]|uniref:Transmembrane protein n=1 Tax=Chlorella sorokiniana TaxID=3076 RepID=A0A2P6TB18_CHLSO|nr:putative transmembrane protein [Chlorella sorokiniana]|eukprot:PRW05748.1 putative transmembrane protein [Chlorella sorokiniana]